MKFTRFLLHVFGVLIILAGASCSSGGSMSGKGADNEWPDASHDIIIIGAGISGLTAAYELKDYNIKVLEKNSSPGGRTISGKYKEYAYAKGTEYLGKPDGVLEKIVKELILNPVEIKSPVDAAYNKSDDKFYWGEEGLLLLHINEGGLEECNSFISEVLDFESKYDYLDSDPSIEYLDDITARQWFINNGFSNYLQAKYNVSARGLFGAGIDDISAFSYIPEIAFDYEGAELITAEEAALLENNPENQEGAQGTYSFVTGITEVSDALAKHLGDKVQLNSTVTSVTKKDDVYHVTYQDSSGNAHTLTSVAVVIAVPSPVALKLAPALLSTEQKEILNTISFSEYITVALFSDEPIFNKAFDLAVPDGHFFTDVYDSTWVQKHYDPDVSDNPETYIASVYIAPETYKDRTLLTLTDDEILEKLYDDWRQIFKNANPDHIKKDIENIVTGYDLHRFEYAYPVMTEGSYKRLKRLNAINSGSLLLAGDYMMYPTYDAAAETGLNASQRAKEYLGPVRRNTDSESIE